MFTYESLLAAALVTTPPGAVSDADIAAWNLVLTRPLLGWGLATEILDERELVGIFQITFDFGRDVRLMQTRHDELVDAPHLEECRRFPTRPQANQWLALNRAVRDDLVCRMGFDKVHMEELELALQHVENAHQTWSALRDAAWPCCYVTARRAALRDLRSLLGLEAFYRGRMPAAAPAWLVPQSP